MALAESQFEDARRLLRQSLNLYQLLDFKLDTAACLTQLATVTLAEARPYVATTLLGAAAAICESARIAIRLDVQNEFDRCLDRSRAQLSEEAFQAAWAAGHEMKVEQIICSALEK